MLLTVDPVARKQKHSWTKVWLYIDGQILQSERQMGADVEREGAGEDRKQSLITGGMDKWKPQK